MIHIPQDLVDVAYKKLKQMVYYDKTLLFLRKRLAEFECESNFAERLEIIRDFISDEHPLENAQLQEWLSEVDFTLAPKSVKPPNKPSEDAGSFVSNVTSERKYSIEKLNYFFDGPIELHLLAVLWVMTAGHGLDNKLSDNCHGSRIHPLVGNDDDHSANLFLKYHEQYSKWRDGGISKAADLLTKENRSVCIISLDLEEFYYRVQLDWNALRVSRPKNSQPKGLMRRVYWRKFLGDNLLACVKAICEAFQSQISQHLKITHPDLPPESTCLPIGLCSSPVIANWYLREFDKEILSEVRPAYYGRYVDDILIVVANDSAPGKDPITTFMKDVLVRTGVMRFNRKRKRYEVTSSDGLFLQKKKCILQFFEAGHSFAGLAKFRKELQENASAFAMLPVEGDESPVEQVAYDLLYDGSVNKFRSVKGIAENRWELAKHLAKQTQMQLLAAEGLDQDTKRELFRFFKGTNAIDYWDMWERVFAFFIAAGNFSEASEFRDMISEELKKIHYESANAENEGQLAKKITQRLRLGMRSHLELSEEISKALRKSSGGSLSEFEVWRRSNLIRHHLVAVPLLNYTNFDGDFVVPESSRQYSISQIKIERSPRFVHFDECVSLVDSWFVENDELDSITAGNKLYSRFHGMELKDVTSQQVNRTKDESE